MLEYFTYKKVKKHQAEKHARDSAVSTPNVPAPVLTEEDENFLERIVSAEGTPPALPERPVYLNQPDVGDSTGNNAQMVVSEPAAATTTTGEGDATSEKTKPHGKGKEKATDTKDAKKTQRFSFFRRGSKKESHLNPTNETITPDEATKEEDDINRVLDDLNLSAVNNRAFSMSKESQILVQKFTLILKDLVNGVPTAYGDLVSLLEDSQGTLAKSYDHLPSFLQKLITTLPSKLTSTLAPELLAVAAEAQALSGASASTAGAGGLGAAAKAFLTPTSLKDLVTKPGAIAGMLKAIMNALKLRWPAFMGTNVLLSLGLFSEFLALHATPPPQFACHKHYTTNTKQS